MNELWDIAKLGVYYWGLKLIWGLLVGLKASPEGLVKPCSVFKRLLNLSQLKLAF